MLKEEIRRVLAPTDFSEFSDRSLAYAANLCQRFKAEMHVLHVIDFNSLVHYGSHPLWVDEEIEKTIHERARKVTEDKLQSVVEKYSNLSKVVTHVEMSMGPATNGIQEYASSHDIDLIVMGSHGRTGLDHILMGSVAEREIREAPCPLLILGSHAKEEVAP